MFSVAGRSTVAPTAARAGVSLYGVAGCGAIIREIGITNTTVNAFVAGLQRFSAATSVGAGLTEIEWDEELAPPQCTAFAGHTADGTTVTGLIRQATIAAAAGSGVVWTFGGAGLKIKSGTANGIGIVCPTGTGQIFDYWIDWQEAS